MDVSELVILRGEQSLLSVRLDRAEVCVGSHPTNDVVIPDPSVPDLALVLTDRGAGRFRLRDLTDGQLVKNGAGIDADETEVADGDVISMGSYALRLNVRPFEDEVRKQIGRTQILGEEKKSERAGLITYRDVKHRVAPSRPFNIGGSQDNDIVIDDEFVSSFHCRISCHDGRWSLVDLESTNGTEVNGLRVREAELPVTASIRIGKAVLSFAVMPEADGRRSSSSAMENVFKLITRMKDRPEPVLVRGESGTGKELVARALHEESARAKGPFLALNCGALSANLIESELFGHAKGTFTGAITDKEGAFEAAGGGTLFLDEIGELPLELQPKLLRVLETSSVRRVGSNRELKIDTRIVAATHRNLEELVDQDRFRQDLYHRLFVLMIAVPPLRERREEILPLAQTFLDCQTRNRKLSFDASAEAALLAHGWPGNVRELRNVVLRSLLMTDGEVISASDLQFSHDAYAPPGTRGTHDAHGTLRRMDEMERARMVDALEHARGNRTEAARILGISKSTFHDRLKRYGIAQRS